jgi:hypothetical protein
MTTVERVMSWEDFKKLAERYGIEPIDPDDVDEDEAGTTEVWVIARGADPPPKRPTDPDETEERSDD